MAPAKTAYVTQFGSPQRGEPGLNQSETFPPSQSVKRGINRSKKSENPARSLLKVKLSKRPARQRDDRTPTSVLESTGIQTRTPITPESVTQSDITAPAPVERDVFRFSQTSNYKTTNGKEKAKLLVLKTISKMLEENRLIRLRLPSTSQAK